jgi:CDP-glycerol glycerophosphotransferase (TagB/SpsB family)
LFATSLFNFDFDVLVSREAKKRGIKVVGMIRSWDNFSSHGLLRVIPDVFLIQNDFLIDMAEKYQGIYRKNVPMKIIGLPHYDEVFNLKEVIEPREKFLSRLNLGPNEKYILYGAMGDFLFERESMDMPKIFDNLVEDGSLKVNKVVYRAHPKFRIESEQKLKNVHFDISGEYVRTAHSGISNNAYLINSIYHSEVLITGASTMAIDSAIIDKPVICVAFDGLAKDGEVSYYSSVKRFYDLYTHFEELVKTGGVKIAYSKEQMVDFVKKYEDDSSLDREGRMAIKDRFCYRIDGLSSKRLFEYLVEELKIS